tara:strand:+ start:45670 stop:45855 length:186 start_codon:yes stop_codon:yes gene_type:complete
MKNCANCYHFYKTPGGSPSECRRYPPSTPPEKGEDMFSQFPKVAHEWYCGEFVDSRKVEIK